MDEVSASTPPGAGPAERRRGKGGLRRFLRRMASSTAELEAEELQKTTDDEGATPITDCAARKRHCVAGTLRTVTLRPRGGAPALEAELYDGTDVINLVWLGRRKIAGIDPGRRLRAEGLVSEQDGRKVMFNPRYELRGGS
ncbi:OB-fold nucleic acid binding domain-containing protein [Spirillospora sp. CA-128828]|uniref:OB-fold nucleic acid binding domain-containing protein n=1 Tax=Spirillospora sp. CA-128828 TaxID=3240033 RepID=UPI003D91CD59